MRDRHVRGDVHGADADEGKTIQPTGKAFKIPMCTVGHWTNGVMDMEWLFWDKLAFMQQVGIAGG